MPLRRSVLEIDVNDESFRRFQEAFEKYRDALSRMPKDWRAVGSETKAATEGFAAIAAALLAQNEMLHRSVHETEELRNKTNVATSAMHGLARRAHGVAHALGGAVKHMVHIAKLGAEISGIGGALGGFGLDRLAVSLGDALRRAQGLGTTVPGQLAFGVEAGRYVDPGSFLSAVNRALIDPTQASWLYNVGVDPRLIAGHDTSAVASAALPGIWRALHAYPRSQLQSAIEAYRLPISGEEATRLYDRPYQDVVRDVALRRQDMRRFGITDQDLKRWQDFQYELKRTGDVLWTTLGVSLAGLAEPLKHVAHSFGDLVVAFGKSPMMRKWITELGDTIEGWAKGFDKLDLDKKVGEWMQDIDKYGRKFWIALNQMAELIGSIYHLFHPAGEGIGSAAVGGFAVGAGVMTKERADAYRNWNSPWGSPDDPSGLGGVRGWINRGVHNFLFGSGSGGANSGGTDNARTSRDHLLRYQRYYDYLINQEHLTPAQAAGMIGNMPAESGGNPASVGDAGTSGGIFQWHNDRWTRMAGAVGAGWRTDWKGQLHYAVQEMRGIDPGYFDPGGDPVSKTAEWTSAFEKPANTLRQARDRALGVTNLMKQIEALGGNSSTITAAGRAFYAEHGAFLRGNSPALVGAPGVKWNSKGEAYSDTLGSMTDKERANQAASYDFIKRSMQSGKPWYDTGAPGKQSSNDIMMRKAPDIHLRITNATGGSSHVAGAQAV